MPEWRSLEVTKILHVLDDLKNAKNAQPGQLSSGPAALERVASSKTSERPPPPGLPINVINPFYLEKLTKYEREALRMLPPVSLSVPADVDKYVIVTPRF